MLAAGPETLLLGAAAQHLAHVANRQNVWYVANGWMYSYRYVAERARVTPGVHN
jgi:hypothetical protein